MPWSSSVNTDKGLCPGGAHTAGEREGEEQVHKSTVYQLFFVYINSLNQQPYEIFTPIFQVRKPRLGVEVSYPKSHS